MLISAEMSSLVLVDFQARLMPAIHDGESVTAQAVKLGRMARLMGVPVIGTEQNPDGLGRSKPEIAELCGAMLAKTWFDACVGRALTSALDAGRPQVVIAGCEAHICLLQTAIGLVEAGRRVFVVADAVGSRRTSDRDAALIRLRRAGAAVVTWEMAAFEWLRHSTHPKFQEARALFK